MKTRWARISPPKFTAEDRSIFVSSRTTLNPDGSRSMTMGGRVCVVDDHIPAAMAKLIARLLNAEVKKGGLS